MARGGKSAIRHILSAEERHIVAHGQRSTTMAGRVGPPR
jgi:hypothetical protein